MERSFCSDRVHIGTIAWKRAPEREGVSKFAADVARTMRKPGYLPCVYGRGARFLLHSFIRKAGRLMWALAALASIALLALRLDAAEVLEDWPRFLGPHGNGTS